MSKVKRPHLKFNSLINITRRVLSMAVASAVFLSCVLFPGNAVLANQSAPEDQLKAEAAINSIDLIYAKEGYKITGNITLPEKSKDYPEAVITWTSSNENVINTSSIDVSSYGGDYTVNPGGRVTRQATDVDVTLTATARVGDYTATKEFHVTVKAAPEKTYAEMDADGDFKYYLYAYFSGVSNTTYCQQTYFAISDDGLNWQDLNYNRPVLTSNLGTGGLRDHYLIRSPEGDKFYLLATDLDASSGNWAKFATAGSKDIIVWESDDLVNWSEPRAITIADENTGCMWAPEAIYDEITGEYIVYWSGHDLNVNSDSYGRKVVYYVKTRDFYTFTKQKKYVYPIDSDGSNGTSRSFIDTTMIKGDDGKYYRVTKYEDVSPTQVFVDVGDYPLGTFRRLPSNLNENVFLGVEGPGWFKFNKDDAEAKGYKYCLMLDGYNGPNSGVGFFPCVIEGLNATENERLTFTKVTSDFKMPTGAKHGGILPITEAEYNAVMGAYGAAQPVYSDTAEIVVEYDFEDPSEGKFVGNAKIVTDEYYLSTIDQNVQSNVLYLDGSSGTYFEFPFPKDENGNPLENYTVSFDIKNLTTGYFFSWYAGDGSSASEGNNYTGLRVYDAILMSDKAGTEKKNTVVTSRINNNWVHIDYTVTNSVKTVYVNGVKKGSFEGYLSADVHADVARLGFSAWSADNYSHAYFDNVKIYNAALSEKGIETYSYSMRKAVDPGNKQISDFRKDLILSLSFDNCDMTTTAGLAKLNGSVEYVDGHKGKAAVFNGTAGNYIELTKEDGSSLLTGLDEFTVSLWSKTSSNLSWWFYAAPDTNNQTYKSEKYVGILDKGTSILCERYNSSNQARPTCPTADVTSGEWKHIAIVHNKDSSTLYINGEVVSTVSSTVDLSDLLGDNSIAYIGKANWENGEFANGVIDEFKIYSRALEESEVMAIAREGEYDDTLLYLSFDDGLNAPVGYAEGQGTMSYEAGILNKAARLNGNYIELYADSEKNSLLAGLEKFTISFWSKSNSTLSWWFYAAPDTNKQTYKSEKYVGVLDKGTSILCERYNSSNQNRPDCPTANVTQGEWKHVAIVHDEESSTLYINGEAVSAVPSSVYLPDMLGSSPIAYIGKANWESGEFANGLIDEFYIYNYDLNAAEVMEKYKYAYNKIIRLSIDSVDVSEDGTLTYSADYNADRKADLHIAVYNENGKLISVKINNPTGSVVLPEPGKYTIVAFLWADNMMPLCKQVKRTVEYKKILIN